MHFSGFVRRGIRAGIFFVLLLAAASVHAAEPVWGKIRWDMSPADVKKLYPKATDSEPQPGKHLLKIGDVEVAGMPLIGGVAFDAEGKMRAILFWVKSGEWVDDDKASVLQEWLFQKYGKPVLDEDERDKRHAQWASPNGPIAMYYVFSGRDPITNKKLDGMFRLEFQPPAEAAPAEPKKE